MKILTLKNRIMFGVYALFLARSVKSPFVAEGLVLGVVGLSLLSCVSVPHFMHNMAGSQSFYHYFLAAFSNTTFWVQGLVVVAFAAAISSLRNFANMVSLRHLSSVGRARLS